MNCMCFRAKSLPITSRRLNPKANALTDNVDKVKIVSGNIRRKCKLLIILIVRYPQFISMVVETGHCDGNC